MADDATQQQAQAPKPEDERIAALVVKNAELLAEAKTARERLRQFSDVFGVDPAKQTPDQVSQARAAEQRERERRAAAVERAVTRSLVTGGHTVPEPVFDLLLTGAIQSQAIKVDESGTVQGAKEYLDGILSILKRDSAAPPKPESAMFPRPDPSKPADPAGQFEGVKTFEDLQALGIARLQEFADKHPDRYAKLRESFNLSLQHPNRVTTQQTPQK